MAGTQTNNLLLLDLTTGRHRTLETGGTPDDLEIGVDVALVSGASLRVNGNLIVEGTTTTTQSETVNIADNHLFLNDGYTTVSAETGGLVVNYLPTAVVDTVAATGFTAGVVATSNPTVSTTAATIFSVGDLVMFTGANELANNGLFEVLSHAANVLTIRGVGTAATTVDFVQNDFVTDTTVAGTITQVNVSILRAGTDGIWETTIGSSTTGLVFSDLDAGVTLNGAYKNDVDGGNATITTDATDGSFVIAGDQSFQVTATNGLNVDTIADFDVTSFDVLMTGTNGFSIDGTAASNVSADAGNLTLSTTTSGNVIVSSAGNVTIDGAVVSIDGTGATNVTATSADLTLATLTSGSVIVNAVGVLNVDGAGIDIDSTARISLDAAAAASNFSLATTGAAQDLTIALTGVQDSSLVLSSTGTGGDALQITASAGGIDINVNTTDATALVIDDGSNDYIIVDSSDTEVEIVQFANLSNGAGIQLTIGTGGVTAGELVQINASGEAVVADANTGTEADAFVVGVALATVVATNPGQIYTFPGSLVPMLFGSAPAGASNGSMVFLDSVAGQATLTPPATGNRVIFQVGTLQGADGADTTPLVLFQPVHIATVP